MGTYKVLKNLRPNIEYAEILKDVASKIAVLEESISPEMIEQIKELSKNVIKMGEEEKIKIENDKREICKNAISATMQNIESFDGDEELRKLAEKAQIHPILPTKFSARKRAELREFEKELFTSSKDKNIKPHIDIER